MEPPLFKPIKIAMIRNALPLAAALAACTSSPQETTMRSPHPAQATTAQRANEAALSGPQSAGPHPAVHGAAQPAAQGPSPKSVSAAENPAPAQPADSPAAAQGRRILSTAFVQVGPDGHLTVELRDGRVLVLRNVVMRPADYCGVQVQGGRAGARFCGSYAQVAAARPDGAPAPQEPDLAAPNPLEPRRTAPKQH